ncbi:hypothetical protein LCGC14_1218620 [marine sediment metagenome]|uniref:Uncharacterized protein n=1 Tax=marine sediment metagenome TaxID=412755 RepID=A0A0F9LBZ3_9ZZZZ
MKISKAIEILTQCASTYPKDSQSEVLDSFKLGIEALRAVDHARTENYWTPIPTMPGETG